MTAKRAWTCTDPAGAPLVDLLGALQAAGYRFVPPTLRTVREARLRRPFARGRSLRDIFGWNRAFRRGDVDPALFAAMDRAGVLRRLALGRFRCTLRVASLGPTPILHSAPSAGRDAVFFGPDSCRFARFLEDAAAAVPHGARVVDLGAGAGAGAIALAAIRPDLRLTLVDINPQAVRLARLNLAAAGIAAEVVDGSGLAAVAGAIDAVVANPPFLGGAIGGTYRAGGGGLGSAVTLDWVRQAIARLEPRGTILLYGASAIMDGEDALRGSLDAELSRLGFAACYRELDPDVFGGMLWRPAYRGVERIALFTLVATRGG